MATKKTNKINAMVIKLFDEVVQEHFNTLWRKDREEQDRKLEENRVTIMEKAMPIIQKDIDAIVAAANTLMNHAKELQVRCRAYDYAVSTYNTFREVTAKTNMGTVNFNRQYDMPNAMSNKCKLIRAEIADCNNVKEAQEVLKKYDIPFDL